MRSGYHGFRFTRWRLYLPLLLLLMVGCSGLAGEPEIVATIPPRPTATVAENQAQTPTTPPDEQATDSATIEDAQTTDEILEGTVGGEVVNGTEGGETPSDLVFTLYVVDLQGGEETFETTINEDGSYLFEGVPIFAPADYYVTTIYQGRTFFAGRGIDDTTVVELEVPITIYEVTNDPSVISITNMLAQITANPGELQVIQVVNFKNDSDMMFSLDEQVGDLRYKSVGVSLPPGALVMDFPGSRTNYIVSDDGAYINDTLPVHPGEDHIMHIIYRLPYDGTVSIEYSLDYSLEGEVHFLLFPESLSLMSTQLPFLGVQESEGVEYQSYGAPLSLEAGDAIRYELNGEGAPSESSTGTQSNNTLAVVLAFVGGAAIFAGMLLYLRSRREPEAAPATDNRQIMDGLIKQIVELDGLHESGEIADELYQKRRKKLKARLEEMMDAD